MRVRRVLDVALLVLLAASAILVFRLAPESPLKHLLDPSYIAFMGYAGSALLIVLLRLLRRGARFERVYLGLFLAAMPWVYIANAILVHSQSWLPLEIVGAVVFTGLAVHGVWRSPWSLVGGILLHGVVWDLSHHTRTPFMPDWYTIGCLVADVLLAAYAALRVERWKMGSDSEER